MEQETTNPLHKTLGLRPGLRGLIVSPPAEDDPLLPLPEGYDTIDKLEDLSAADGLFDYIHVFVRSRAELATHLTELKERLSPKGALWISWIGPTSDQRGALRPADLNDSVIRRLALTHALVDAKSSSLDRTWSATKLVHRRH